MKVDGKILTFNIGFSQTLEHTLREHNEELRTLQKTITQLEAQVGELQFTCENQKKQIFDYKETVCSLQSEVKGIRLECEGE